MGTFTSQGTPAENHTLASAITENSSVASVLGLHTFSCLWSHFFSAYILEYPFSWFCFIGKYFYLLSPLPFFNGKGEIDMKMITVRRSHAFMPSPPSPGYPPHIRCRWLRVPYTFLDHGMVFVHEVCLMATYRTTPNLVLNKPTNKDSQICWKFKKQKQTPKSKDGAEDAELTWACSSANQDIFLLCPEDLTLEIVQLVSDNIASLFCY